MEKRREFVVPSSELDIEGQRIKFAKALREEAGASPVLGPLELAEAAGDRRCPAPDAIAYDPHEFTPEQLSVGFDPRRTDLLHRALTAQSRWEDDGGIPYDAAPDDPASIDDAVCADAAAARDNEPPYARCNDLPMGPPEPLFPDLSDSEIPPDTDWRAFFRC